MKKTNIGKTDMLASVVGLGTWTLGGGTWWGDTDEKAAIDTVSAAIDSGITLIDTAPAYNYGRSETLVGKAIAGRRDKVIISTKCGLWWGDDQGSFAFELDGHKVYKSLKPETLQIEIENSLKRLGTDYIDIYHTHWQAIEPCKTPIEETMSCLLKMVDQGKIRSIGVSNATVEDIQEYQKHGKVSTNQPKYSMLDRVNDKELLPFCKENGISNIVYSPLEQGLLTGKVTMESQFGEGEFRSSNIWFRPANRQRVIHMLESWKDLTEKYDCTLSQLVIAWTVSQENVDIALCGARKPEQVIANAKGGEITITELDRMSRDIEALGEAE